jgi:iron(III) transport system permease protein
MTRRAGRLRRFGRRIGAAGLGRPLSLALVCGGLVGLPVLSVFASFIDAPASADTLRHLAATVIPAAAIETVVLAIGVVAGVVVLGASTGWLTAGCDFSGRRIFEWALLLPLAMPAYIVAYAYTDALQFAGPLQTSLREWFGWRRGDYWFPEIRSLAGGMFVFTVVLYPYVYLLARTAFMARTAAMLDAARSLGLTPWQTWWRVNMPLARPAIAAGALLALMETIADYGASVYFGLQTFTTAIYRAWFALGDRMAASQLAAVLLVLVLMLLARERHARGRARYFAPTASQRPAPRAPLRGWRAAGAVATCTVPVVLGFVLPVLLLLRLLIPAWTGVDWARYGHWLLNTLGVASGGAVVVLVAVLALAYSARTATAGLPRTLVQVSVQLMSMGYALPGAVIAVGILVPLAAFDNGLDGLLKSVVGWGPGLLLTGSVFALLYGYLVRYFAVAYQSIEAGLTRITPAMDASARSLGSPPLDTFVRVHLPILAPSVWAAVLLVFVDAMKELPATLVLRPFNFDTLAVAAYQMASDERLADAALPALTIVAAGVIPVALLSRAIARAAGPGHA